MIRAIVLLLFCAAAPGQELLTPGQQVMSELRAALAAGDEAKAVSLLSEVGGLFRYPTSEREAAALLVLAGQATHSKKKTVVIAALGALGDTGAREAANHVKRFLQIAEPELMVAAVGAAGRLRAQVLIPRLREPARKSANMTVADQAFVALSEFCRTPAAVRKRVAEGVLADCQTMQRIRKRWRRLRAPGLRALQRLIGRRMNSVAQFAAWWKVAKTRKDPFRS